jgi:thiosulfate/3-mercaptopyruvate sulfurtransferase
MTTYTTLIDAVQLQALVREAAPLVVLDASFDLADPGAGERSYREQHLPGAHYLHLDRDLCAPKTGTNGRHPLPTRETFAALAGRLCIQPSTQVVVYDRQGAAYAARAWWMLRWLGHPAVAVLDGGLKAWQATGSALTTDVPPLCTGAAPYLPRKTAAKTIDAQILMRLLGRHPLIDARSPERFRGDVEPLDAQAGHIPGARNRHFKDNLDSDGRFKSAQQLRAEFTPLLGGAPATQAVHQCGSGVTACHNLLAMEHAALTGSALYPGSWSEWSADPARPVARH